MSVIEYPAPREANAFCKRCGRRGTWALLVSSRGDVARYCRRCWPRAHRLSLEKSEREALAPPVARHGDTALGSPAAGGNGGPEPVRVRGAWHWSLTPGSLWRIHCHLRRVRDIRR